MNIFTVAFRDLKATICSMRGGALAFIFLFFVGAFFYSFVLTLLEIKLHSSYRVSPSLEDLTKAIFHNFHFVLLLVVPAVTMGTFAEERQSGLYRLLRVAPLSSFEIVLGKFLASFIAVTGVCILSGVYFFWIYYNGNPDLGVYLSSSIGIFLLVLLKISFGVFVSSVTRNQFLAFLFTIAGLFLMLVINWILPTLSSQVQWVDAVKLIATTTHLDPFLEGMVSLSDISYFVSFALFFLFLTVVSYEADRFGGCIPNLGGIYLLSAAFLAVFGLCLQKYASNIASLTQGIWILCLGVVCFWLIKFHKNLIKFFRSALGKFGLSYGLSILLVFCILLGAGLFLQRPGYELSFDLTRSGLHSLSQDSKKLVKSWSNARPIRVLCFFENQKRKKKFEKILRLYSDLPITSVDYFRPNLHPIKAVEENITMADTVILKSSNSQARLTSFTEEKFTNALLKIRQPSQKKIGILVGHGEGSTSIQGPDGYSLFAAELQNNKYELISVDLKKSKLVEDLDLLVILAPKYDIYSKEVSVLNSYLAQGGKILAIVGAASSVVNLNKVLARVGLSFGEDMLLQPEGDPRINLLGRDTIPISIFDEYHPLTYELSRNSTSVLLFNKARSIISTSQAEIASSKLVAFTDPEAAKVGLLNDVIDNRETKGRYGVMGVGTHKGVRVAFSNNAKSGERVQSYGNKSRNFGELVAFGSASAASNKGLQRGENFDILIGAVSYLLRQDNFISIPSKYSNSELFDMSKQSLFFLFILSWIYPFAFLILGIIFWRRGRSL